MGRDISIQNINMGEYINIRLHRILQQVSVQDIKSCLIMRDGSVIGVDLTGLPLNTNIIEESTPKRYVSTTYAKDPLTKGFFMKSKRIKSLLDQDLLDRLSSNSNNSIDYSRPLRDPNFICKYIEVNLDVPKGISKLATDSYIDLVSYKIQRLIPIILMGHNDASKKIESILSSRSHRKENIKNNDSKLSVTIGECLQERGLYVFPNRSISVCHPTLKDKKLTFLILTREVDDTSKFEALRSQILNFKYHSETTRRNISELYKKCFKLSLWSEASGGDSQFQNIIDGVRRPHSLTQLKDAVREISLGPTCPKIRQHFDLAVNIPELNQKALHELSLKDIGSRRWSIDSSPNNTISIVDCNISINNILSPKQSSISYKRTGVACTSKINHSNDFQIVFKPERCSDDKMFNLILTTLYAIMLRLDKTKISFSCTNSHYDWANVLNNISCIDGSDELIIKNHLVDASEMSSGAGYLNKKYGVVGNNLAGFKYEVNHYEPHNRVVKIDLKEISNHSHISWIPPLEQHHMFINKEESPSKLLFSPFSEDPQSLSYIVNFRNNSFNNALIRFEKTSVILLAGDGYLIDNSVLDRNPNTIRDIFNLSITELSRDYDNTLVVADFFVSTILNGANEQWHT